MSPLPVALPPNLPETIPVIVQRDQGEVTIRSTINPYTGSEHDFRITRSGYGDLEIKTNVGSDRPRMERFLTRWHWWHSQRIKEPRGDSAENQVLSATSRLVELSRLEANWDGAGAEPPTAEAIACSFQLIITLQALNGGVPIGVTPAISAPIPDGGLQLEWQGVNARAEVEVGPEGDFGFLVIEDHPESKIYREGDGLELGDIAEVVLQAVRPG